MELTMFSTLSVDVVWADSPLTTLHTMDDLNEIDMVDYLAPEETAYGVEWSAEEGWVGVCPDGMDVFILWNPFALSETPIAAMVVYDEDTPSVDMGVFEG